MGRIRTIKPEFLLHEGLYDLEMETGLPVRLAFAGLWTQCDREGRFRWQPRKLKVTILPYDELDFSRVLDALSTRGFVVKYACSGEEFGYVTSFLKHQVINNREKESELPEPNEINTLTRDPRVSDACPTVAPKNLQEGKGREGKGREQENTCPEPLAPADEESIVISLPTNKHATAGEEFHVTESFFTEMQTLYPSVDVEKHMREMRGWLITNQGKRKTISGMPRFINSWLADKQNNGGERYGRGKSDSRTQDTRRLTPGERTQLARERAYERERLERESG